MSVVWNRVQNTAGYRAECWDPSRGRSPSLLLKVNCFAYGRGGSGTIKT
jgi:hypothetical protein